MQSEAESSALPCTIKAWSEEDQDFVTVGAACEGCPTVRLKIEMSKKGEPMLSSFTIEGQNMLQELLTFRVEQLITGNTEKFPVIRDGQLFFRFKTPVLNLLMARDSTMRPSILEDSRVLGYGLDITGKITDKNEVVLYDKDSNAADAIFITINEKEKAVDQFGQIYEIRVQSASSKDGYIGIEQIIDKARKRE